MTIPLVMLGPGGDFTTTLNVRGRGLTRQTGPTQGHDPQGESAGGLAQWGRWRRTDPEKASRDGSGDLSGGGEKRAGDRFEHVPDQVPADVYTQRGMLSAVPGRRAVLAAALYWLNTQQRTVRRLGGLVSALKQAVLAVPDTGRSQAEANHTGAQAVNSRPVTVRVAGPPAALVQTEAPESPAG